MVEDILLGADADAGLAEGEGIAEFDVATPAAEGVIGWFGEEDEEEVAAGDVVEVVEGALPEFRVGEGGFRVGALEPGCGDGDAVLGKDRGDAAGIVYAVVTGGDVGGGHDPCPLLGIRSIMLSSSLLLMPFSQTLSNSDPGPT